MSVDDRHGRADGLAVARRTSSGRSPTRLLYGVLLIKAVGARAARGAGAERRRGRGSRRAEARRSTSASRSRCRAAASSRRRSTTRTSRRLDELMANFRDLVQRARAGQPAQLGDVRPDDHGHQPRRGGRGGGVRPDLSAAGRARRLRPADSSGRCRRRRGASSRARSITPTLSADHRVIDGHRGSVFLAALDRLLQEPEKL